MNRNKTWDERTRTERVECMQDNAASCTEIAEGYERDLARYEDPEYWQKKANQARAEMEMARADAVAWYQASDAIKDGKPVRDPMSGKMLYPGKE